MTIAHRSLYLAGPISGLPYEEARHGWRKEFATLMGERAPHVECFSPMRQKEFLCEQQSLQCKGEDLDKLNHALARPLGILTRDHNDVKERDALVACFLDHAPGLVSIGTVWEIGVAFAYRKPVIVVMKPGDIHDHIFITHSSGYVVDSLDEASLIAASILTPDV